MDKRLTFAILFGNSPSRPVEPAFLPWVWGFAGVSLVLLVLVALAVAPHPDLSSLWFLPIPIPLMSSIHPKRFRPIDAPKDYVANETVAIELPQEPTTHVGVLLDVNGTLDVTVAATLRDDAPQNIISRLALVGDGDTIQAWPGRSLYAFNYFMAGGNHPALVKPAVGVAANAFRAWYFLYFKLPRSGNPMLTYLNPRRFSTKPRIEITWAPVATLISAGTATITGTTVRAHLLELLIDPTPFTQLLRVAHLPQTFTAAHLEAKVGLGRDNLYRGILIRTSDESTGHVLSDTLLNRVKVKIRETVDLYDAFYDTQQSFQRMEQRLQADFTAGTPTGEGSRAEGYLWVDFLERGASSDLIDARDANEFDAILDVDAATRIDISTIMVSP